MRDQVARYEYQGIGGNEQHSLAGMAHGEYRRAASTVTTPCWWTSCGPDARGAEPRPVPPAGRLTINPGTVGTLTQKIQAVTLSHLSGTGGTVGVTESLVPVLAVPPVGFEPTLSIF